MSTLSAIQAVGLPARTRRFSQTPAVVVGVCGHGLALVRGLRRANVPVLALESNIGLPGMRTDLAEVVQIPAINGPLLIDTLLALRPRLQCPGTPVLFLTNDTMVRTVGEHWPRLQGKYALSWGHARERLTPLLDKPALEARCLASGVKYPATFVLQQADQIDAALHAIGFPMIVKPARPLSRFKTAQPADRQALQDLLTRFEADLPFLVQNFIPGDDTAIHFSALYLDKGEVLARFDGHKLRSRPLGHTSIAEPQVADDVYERTLQFFEGLALSGPVSLELKRDPAGQLWVIEPTIGRTDFWVDVCIANGVNLPLIEYQNQTGQPITPPIQRDDWVWFNEDRDPLGRLWLAGGGAGGMRGRGSAFVFLHRHDMGPALRFVGQTLNNRLGAVGRRLQRWIGLSAKNTPPDAATDPTPDPHCQAWHDLPALRAEPAWRGLAKGAQSVFETPAWFDNLATTCPVPGTHTLVLGVASPQGTTFLPLRERGGGKLESLSNFYAPLFSPLSTAAETAVQHAPAIAAWLQQRRAATLQLHPLDPLSPFWRAMVQALRAQGYWVDSYFSFGNWYHPCKGESWSHYLAARPARLRNTIIRGRKRLAANPAVSISMLSSDAADETVARAVTDFNTVYARSWKKPEPFADFIGAFVRLAHEQGWLRMALCHLDGAPVAGQIWLVRDGVASIFKLAYDEGQRRLGAGTVLSALLTEHVLDVDKVEEIDFLAGDDPYKAEWMSHRRERRGIVAFLPGSLTGLSAAALHYGARAFRRRQSRGQWEGRGGVAANGRGAGGGQAMHVQSQPRH